MDQEARKNSNSKSIFIRSASRICFPLPLWPNHSPYLFIMLKFARFLCCSCCYAQSLAYFENFIISMGAKGDYGSTQYLRFAIKFKYF